MAEPSIATENKKEILISKKAVVLLPVLTAVLTAGVVWGTTVQTVKGLEKEVQLLRDDYRYLRSRMDGGNVTQNNNQSVQIDTNDTPDVKPGTWVSTSTMKELRGYKTVDSVYNAIARGELKERKKSNGRLEVLYEGP